LNHNACRLVCTTSLPAKNSDRGKQDKFSKSSNNNYLQTGFCLYQMCTDLICYILTLVTLSMLNIFNDIRIIIIYNVFISPSRHIQPYFYSNNQSSFLAITLLIVVNSCETINYKHKCYLFIYQIAYHIIVCTCYKPTRMQFILCDLKVRFICIINYFKKCKKFNFKRYRYMLNFRNLELITRKVQDIFI